MDHSLVGAHQPANLGKSVSAFCSSTTLACLFIEPVIGGNALDVLTSKDLRGERIIANKEDL
jgi:hypothetical protein